MKTTGKKRAILELIGFGYPLLIVLIAIIPIQADYLSTLVYRLKLNIYLPPELIAFIFLVVFAIYIVRIVKSPSNLRLLTSLLITELTLTLIVNKLLLVQLIDLIVSEHIFLKIPSYLLDLVSRISFGLFVIGVIILFVGTIRLMLRLIANLKAKLKEPQIDIGPVEVQIPRVNMNTQSIIPALIITIVIFGIMFYIVYDIYQITQDNRWEPSTQIREY